MKANCAVWERDFDRLRQQKLDPFLAIPQKLTYRKNIKNGT